MRADQAETLRQAVADRRNILVAGGTSTGKTTLTNALLAEVSKTSDRVVLIEEQHFNIFGSDPLWRGVAGRGRWHDGDQPG